MAQKDLFIAELVFTLVSLVQENVTPCATQTVTSLPEECHISQNIIGEYNAHTAIYGDTDALKAFANAYSKFDVEDEILDEILADFLNLNNGRFIVSLSDTYSIECSLSVPNMNTDEPAALMQNTYIIPMSFSFGTVNFVLSE